jgi:hypothetical protein
MNSAKKKRLEKKISAFKDFINTVKDHGDSLLANNTRDKYLEMYEDIRKTMNDPDFETFVPNISGGFIVGGTGILSEKHETEILECGRLLIAYVEKEMVDLPQAPAAAESTHEGQNQMEPLEIFISHSSKDKNLVGSFIELLKFALNVPAESIRCTSVDGYRLPAGERTVLRAELIGGARLE